MCIGVIIFFGLFDDCDVQCVVCIVGVELVFLWYGLYDFEGVDVFVFFGGFSYGDYLCVGVIVVFFLIMVEVKDVVVKGMFVFGICNGFQMLVEVYFFFGGLICNNYQYFVCCD